MLLRRHAVKVMLMEMTRGDRIRTIKAFELDRREEVVLIAHECDGQSIVHIAGILFVSPSEVDRIRRRAFDRIANIVEADAKAQNN